MEETKIIGDYIYVLGPYTQREKENIEDESISVKYVSRENPTKILGIVWDTLNKNGIEVPIETRTLAFGNIMVAQEKEGPAIISVVHASKMHTLTVFYSLKKWIKKDGDKEKILPLNMDFFYDNIIPYHVDILFPIAEKINNLSEQEKNALLTPPLKNLNGQEEASNIEIPSK